MTNINTIISRNIEAEETSLTDKIKDKVVNDIVMYKTWTVANNNIEINYVIDEIAELVLKNRS